MDTFHDLASYFQLFSHKKNNFKEEKNKYSWKNHKL